MLDFDPLTTLYACPNAVWDVFLSTILFVSKPYNLVLNAYFTFGKVFMVIKLGA
jgi:hypothetical protein